MTIDLVRRQIYEVIGRLIEANLSVRQFYPSESDIPGGGCSIGNLPSSFALKNVPYSDIYRDLDENQCFHVKLPDGGLISFQYTFDAQGGLNKHRLCFFPPHTLPTAEEAPLLYENDELYGDIVVNRIVRFPLRFDFDPASSREIIHPSSHATIGQFENCRIPVNSPIEPNSFVLFLLRNFYHRSYIRHKNLFDKSMHKVGFATCIKPSEQRIAHLIFP